MMRCFVDSADDAAVGALLRERLVHGVTTNPTILAAAGLEWSALPRTVRGWIELGASEVFLQTWGSDRAAMLEHAEALRAIAPEVAIKVPATEVGFGVAATLVERGETVLLTAVYEAPQALVAASIGVRYIAPYVGRLDDAGRDGLQEVATMAELLRGSGTEILAASVRSPQVMVALAKRGVTACTARPELLRAALASADADAAARGFEAAMDGLLRPAAPGR